MTSGDVTFRRGRFGAEGRCRIVRGRKSRIGGFEKDGVAEQMKGGLRLDYY
jgi:hypothetical protein